MGTLGSSGAAAAGSLATSIGSGVPFRTSHAAVKCSGVAAGSVTTSMGSTAAAGPLASSVISGVAVGLASLFAGLAAPSRSSVAPASSGAPAGPSALLGTSGAPAGPSALPGTSGAAAWSFSPSASSGVPSEDFTLPVCSESKVFFNNLKKEKAQHHYRDDSISPLPQAFQGWNTSFGHVRLLGMD